MMKILILVLTLIVAASASKFMFMSDACIISYNTASHDIVFFDDCFLANKQQHSAFMITCFNYNAQKSNDLHYVNLGVYKDKSKNFVNAYDWNNDKLAYSFVSFSKDLNNGQFNGREGKCFFQYEMDVINSDN